MSERELSGMVACVTGGSSGIGLATAQLLRDRGASVVIVDPLSPTAGEGMLHLPADVTDDASVRAVVGEVKDTFGRLDIVVNNAGIGAVGTVEDHSDDEWRRVLEVNLLGVVRMSRAALPYLRQSPAASIVNVGSIAATAGLPARAIYSASKGALIALTLAMAADHVLEGVRVNAVAPGTVATAWVDRLLSSAEDPLAAKRALEARQPTGRLVTAEEVAGAIAYLASPASSSTTGAVLAVDGGMSGLRLPGKSA
ncbi:MAG: Dihydroanticapsin 7-dehydrogenase [Nitrospira sp.]|nr:Dihydroanticapsin 7-dehydrogenase [Nitrospira sp.]